MPLYVFSVELYGFLGVFQSFLVFAHDFEASGPIGKKYTFGVVELLSYTMCTIALV